MPATTSGNVSAASGPRWWDRTINALVPAALIAAMIAHAFPFIVRGQGLYPVDLESGFSSFFIGFFVLTVAPLDPFFEAFSLPLIAAFVGLIYQRRPGWIGSACLLGCGPDLSGICVLWERPEHLAYGYFAARRPWHPPLD